MKGLLDTIFENINIQDLDRGKAGQYLQYLREILRQLTTREDKVKFFPFRTKLNQQLVNLDQNKVRDLNM